MDRKMRAACAAGLGLMLSLSLFGCNDKGTSINPPAGIPLGIGIVDTVPQIDGDWVAQSKVL